MSGSRFLVATAICGLAACGGRPSATAPASGLGAEGQLRILGDPVVTLTPSRSIALAVEERDAAGRIVTANAHSYTWTSSAPAVASPGDDGVLQATGLGEAVVTAQSAAGRTATVTVWVELPASAPQTYHITLVYADGVPDEWRTEFAAAAAQWEGVIRGELPPAEITINTDICSPIPDEPEMPPFTGLERGTRIYIGWSGHYPAPTFVEATGGPCVQRPLPSPTTVFGRIILNRAKPIASIKLSRRHYIALHEMGHVLGLVGVLQGIRAPWFDATSGAYTGSLALEGYRRFFGFSVTGLYTTGNHWQFVDDIMGGGELQITPVSVGSLMDTGYRAIW